jgi:hypothetical protein
MSLEVGSTIRSLAQQAECEPAHSVTTRWRSWPLVDNWRWSWLLPVGILCVGAMAAWLGGGWLVGIVAVGTLAVAMWQFLLPVTYEICSLGVRRYALARMRLVPWSGIHAYQLRSTGVVFFRRTDPTTLDVFNSLFVPYSSDEDEVVVAVRLYLPHAVELP